MNRQEELLIAQVTELHHKISSLSSLSPSPHVDALFTQLVQACMPPASIDVTKISDKRTVEMRAHLIALCAEAEGLLELHFSSLLSSFGNPTRHLDIFPYYSNYLKLSLLEFTLLAQYSTRVPSRVAFVGSGPLPLTSIVLATRHLTATTFDNYDINPSANSLAEGLISSDPDLSKRMAFHTADILLVSEGLRAYDVVFLAALVGLDREEKNKIVGHLAEFMAPGAILMLRSAHGARAFLYPVVDPCDLIGGFEVLSVYHPTDEVINSVVIARKHCHPKPPPVLHHHHSQPLMDQGQHAGNSMAALLPMPGKCSEIILSRGNMIIEELAMEREQLS